MWASRKLIIPVSDHGSPHCPAGPVTWDKCAAERDWLRRAWKIGRWLVRLVPTDMAERPRPKNREHRDVQLTDLYEKLTALQRRNAGQVQLYYLLISHGHLLQIPFPAPSALVNDLLN